MRGFVQLRLQVNAITYGLGGSALGSGTHGLRPALRRIAPSGAWCFRVAAPALEQRGLVEPSQLAGSAFEGEVAPAREEGEDERQSAERGEALRVGGTLHEAIRA